MLSFLTFLAGAAVGGGAMFALFARGVLKAPAPPRQVIVLDPEQDGADPRVETRSE